jgi:zinc D-Ala-D-Ala carboxypeptidase
MTAPVGHRTLQDLLLGADRHMTLQRRSPTASHIEVFWERSGEGVFTKMFFPGIIFGSPISTASHPKLHEVIMSSHKAKWKKQNCQAADSAEPAEVGASLVGAQNRADTRPAPTETVGAEESTGPSWDNIRHFTPRDFACQCAGLCDHPVVISVETVAKLDEICDAIGLPVKILSGSRCKRYNNRISGQSRSAHVPKNGVSHAAHVFCPDSSFRFAFLTAALPVFNRIGIGKDFIHIDDDPELPPKVVWVCGA